MLNRRPLAVLAALGCVGSSWIALPAVAADLDSGYAEMMPDVPQQLVTFGSGWYVRGDIGAEQNLDLTEKNNALGAAPDVSFTRGKDARYVASLGAGYSFNRWFRADAVFDYHQQTQVSRNGSGFTCRYAAYGLPISGPFAYTAFNTEHCGSQLSAKVTSYDVLANGYIDLGNWYGFTPYVGAGAGMSFGEYQTSVNYFYPNAVPYDFTYTDPVSGATLNENFDRTRSANYYHFAWALMAGFAYDIYAHTKLDVSYRYLNLGRVGNSNIALQEARVGLRYMIDN